MTDKPTYEHLERRVQELEKQVRELEARETKTELAEAQYLGIFNAANDAFLICDKNGVIKEVNPAACRMYGYSRDEMIGLTGKDIVHLDFQNLLKAFLEKASQGYGFSAESFDMRKDGTAFPVEVSGSGFIWNGESHLLAAVRDITDRKEIEAALRVSESRRRSFFETGPDGVVILDPDSLQFIEFNDQACRQLGYSHEELARVRLPVIDANESEEEARAHTKELIEKGFGDFETLHRTKQGELRHVHVRAQAIDIRNRKVLHSRFSDITDRKQMERALQESERKYKDLFSNAQVALFRTDIAKGRCIEINERYAQIAGYESIEACKANFHPGKAWVDPNARDEVMKKLLRDGAVSDCETEVVRGDGSHLWISFSATIYPEKGYLEGSLVDITSRKQTERLLRENEQKYRSFLENLVDGAFETDEKGNLTYVNRAAAQIAGIPARDLIGKPFLPLFNETSQWVAKDVYEGSLSGANPGLYELEFTNGKTCQFKNALLRDENETVTGVFGIMRDITKQKSLEAGLRRREAILNAVAYEAEQLIRSSALEEETIKNILARLGEAASVSRVYIFENYTADVSTMMEHQIHEWTSPGIAPQINNAALKYFPLRSGWFQQWAEAMGRGKSIYGSVKDFPAKERSFFSFMDIQSILMVPVFVQETWWGFIGFDECQAEREWLSMEIDALKTAASILGLAIERKQSQEKIFSALKEKDVLLREIHHRVKNNMQVTCSLLRLQARQTDDRKIAGIFKESENRIRTMALIHDSLYRSEDLASIRFRDYAKELVRHQFISYGVDTNDISYHMKIDDISLEIDMATPSGMIINELVTNSLKYAFPKGRKGEITVSLRAVDHGGYELMVTDNGIGLPKEVDPSNSPSFGLYMVRLLAEKQLNGKMEVLRETGTGYRIRFDTLEFSE